MSGNGGTTPSFPYASNDTTPASLARSGHMRRWAVPTATIGGFTTTGVGTQQRVGVAPATASVAGALSAADFAKLASLKHPTLALNYTAATDFASGFAATAALGWFTLLPDQTFPVTSPTAFVLVEVEGAALVTSAGFVAVAARLLYDGATPVLLPGTACNAGAFAPLGFGSAVVGTNLTAGNHTVRLELQVNGNTTLYCRTASNPPYEFIHCRILEVAP